MRGIIGLLCIIMVIGAFIGGSENASGNEFEVEVTTYQTFTTSGKIIVLIANVEGI